MKNAFGRVPMEEALQSGKSAIAEYLAPRTILEDDKLYSTIPEAAIYMDARGNTIGEEEEEKKDGSDDRSM